MTLTLEAAAEVFAFLLLGVAFLTLIMSTVILPWAWKMRLMLRYVREQAELLDEIERKQIFINVDAFRSRLEGVSILGNSIPDIQRARKELNAVARELNQAVSKEVGERIA